MSTLYFWSILCYFNGQKNELFFQKQEHFWVTPNFWKVVYINNTDVALAKKTERIGGGEKLNTDTFLDGTTVLGLDNTKALCSTGNIAFHFHLCSDVVPGHKRCHVVRLQLPAMSPLRHNNGARPRHPAHHGGAREWTRSLSPLAPAAAVLSNGVSSRKTKALEVESNSTKEN